MHVPDNKDNLDFFDDDFEVTYLDDNINPLPEEAKEETKRPIPKTPPKQAVKASAPPKKAASPRTIKDNNAKKPTNARCKSKKSRKRLPNLISPAGKAVQAGGKAATKVVQLLFRLSSFLLMIGIFLLILINFYRHYPEYGSLQTIVSERNYALTAYLAVGLLLLFFELVSFLFALTQPRAMGEKRSYKIDTGRGLFSFLCIGAGAWLADVAAGLLPQSPPLLVGLKGGLLLYGSLKHTLLVLCTAGVISCLLRRFTSR